MAYHGQPLDVDYDPAKEDLYSLFSQYFKNPKMTKIKDINNYSMYICKIHALLGIEYRYVIVFVNKDELPNGTEKFLLDLYWISLQTRTLTDEHNIPSHAYIPRRIPELDKKIQITTKNNEQYKYKVDDLPIEITLLPKSKGLDYQPTGTVVTALETYHTIVSFLKNSSYR